MNEVKWVKIYTDMISNKKIKRIRKLPEGNNIVLIWVFLLVEAGTSNKHGGLFLTDTIPFTEDDLAIELEFDVDIVRLALGVLERFGMIEVFEGIIFIKNWGKYQSLEKHEEYKEKNKLRNRDFRQRQKNKALELTGQTEKMTSRDVTHDITHDANVIQNDTTEEEEEEEVRKESYSDKKLPFPVEGYPFSDQLKEKILQWHQYKIERKESYKKTGFQQLLNKIQRQAEIFGEDAVIHLINESMSNNWAGIIWDRIQSVKKETNKKDGLRRAEIEW